jgi:hypothetical protein
MSEDERPRNTKVVPNYESFVMLRVNEIVEAMNKGRGQDALIMLRTFFATLPDEIKKAMDEKRQLLDATIEIISQQRGLTAYQSFRTQHFYYQRAANLYVLPILYEVGHQLYLGGYMEQELDRYDLSRPVDASKHHHRVTTEEG